MAKFIPVTNARAATMDPHLLRALGAAQHGPLTDALDRRLRDLRISVTDRCNFRCVYCMPKEIFNSSYRFLLQERLLSFEEIARVARVFVDAGVRKIRLTGGEPLLRKRIETLIEKLARLPVALTLTTNGALLARKAKSLRDAGLGRVTVSLDALDDPTFRRMNDVDFPVGEVLKGIDAAAEAGFGPVKINAVIKRGVNEHAVVDMARHFRDTGHIVRFIEYMDVGVTNGWRMDDIVPASALVAAIEAHWPVRRVAAHYQGEVAQRWRYADGAGEIGIIASVTEAFCRDCTRARLSADGTLYTCLFAANGHDLRAQLRGGVSDDDLAHEIAGIWRLRGDRYSELRTEATTPKAKVEMSHIGG